MWQEFTKRPQLSLSEHELDYAIGRKATEVVAHFLPAATADEASALVQERQELYRGKAKTVYATDDPGLLVMHFRGGGL